MIALRPTLSAGVFVQQHVDIPTLCYDCLCFNCLSRVTCAFNWHNCTLNCRWWQLENQYTTGIWYVIDKWLNYCYLLNERIKLKSVLTSDDLIVKCLTVGNLLC